MRNKRILYVLMAIILVVPSFLVTANLSKHVEAAEDATGEYASKDEVVYATLSPTGERQEVYVVNIFDVIKEGKIVDNGLYSNLKNLTNLSELEQTEDNTVAFTAPEDKFYYQGNLENAELPWDITITYLLDGKETEAAELAGQDGKVEIKIETSANENVDPVFFENYLLQISLNLEPEIYDNIVTEGGVVANAGKNKQVTFTVMPEQAGELTVKADVVDFELQGMEIAAVPQSMSIDAPDMDEMTGEMDTLTKAIRDISNGVGELNTGVSDLNSGVASLRDGSGQYLEGITDVNGASDGLIDGSIAINEGLTQMSNSLRNGSSEMDLSGLKELPNGLSQLAEGLHQTSDGLTKLNENYTVAYSSLDEAMLAIPDYKLTDEEIADLNASDANSEVVKKLLETYQATRNAKGTYSAVKEAFAAVDPTLNEVSGSVTEIANTMERIAAEITTSLEGMNMADSIGELQAGLATLSANYKTFHAGLVSYTDGVGQLSSSYQDVHTGIVELSGGTSELESGVEELDDGTDTLYQSTKDMPDEMQEEINQMIDDYDKSDLDAVSFVSAENEKINSVQFVIKTESIEKQEQESNEEQEEEEPKGFWDRLLDLFKN
ncbi:YhgE/Pip domain-containing protein [Paraliobacillus sediminis]|uniref:YhgE/Pip domain-containing protein n=1 Tax=Paraliobacillus sediminis TaxID=1885916 RepID=UPI0013C2FFEC|nr:YhgE/Pip domain-containing protein [Paraliobacillus sediminis]